ncbi:MAG: hypothetical protein ACR2QO_16090 [Acidimicrobiales bacterium]
MIELSSPWTAATSRENQMPTRLLTSFAVAIAAVGLAGCGSDDPADGATTQVPAEAITIDDWVSEFDRFCVETAAELTSDLSDEEFAEISNAAIAEMRTIGEPSTLAAEAALLVDTIETQSNDHNLTEEEVAALDEEFLEAATTLGISDECLYGAQG